MSRFQVAKKRCSQCLFSDAKIVSEERKQEILTHCAKKDNYFVCHKKTANNKNVCCRGFFDSAHGERTTVIQIATRLNLVQFLAVKEN